MHGEAYRHVHGYAHVGQAVFFKKYYMIWSVGRGFGQGSV